MGVTVDRHCITDITCPPAVCALRDELKKLKVRYMRDSFPSFGIHGMVSIGRKVIVFFDDGKDNDPSSQGDSVSKSGIHSRNLTISKKCKQLYECGWKTFSFYANDLENNIKECAKSVKNAIEDNGPRYVAIDLFAGIGGIRLGFQNAFEEKMTVKMVSENNPYAQMTYRANFSHPYEIKSDIRDVRLNSVPNYDICLAGFPCQAFSSAGKKEGFNDETHGTLFYEVVRLCKSKKPMVIFCENVKGLLSNDRGRTFSIIIDNLESMGYKPKCTILNSKDFGVPQNRERIYMVAFRNDIQCDDFEFPTLFKERKKLCDIVEREPVDESFYLSQQYLDTLERHKAYHNAKGHGFGYICRDYLEENDCSCALMCGGMGRERNMLFDPRTSLPDVNPRTKRPYNDKHYRMMTPREWARLQGFPEDFEFPVARTHQYRQLGNTVTVPVIEAIARQIRPILDKHLQSGGQRHFRGTDFNPTNDTE